MGVYKRSEYALKRMSEGAKTRKITPLFREARVRNAKINPNYGMRGKHHSKETRNKISENNGKGMLGKHHSEESIEKMSINRKGKALREKSSNWKGGVSFESYPVEWTQTLKRAIRERDNYICQNCSQYGDTVHHIDYDKKNCNPENLITLCRRCNSKVNFRREYWIEFFKQRFVN